MRVLFSLLLTTAFLTGCAKKNTDAVTVNQNAVVMADTSSTAIPATSTYLALGDSYTIGQSVQLTESFPYQLSARLGLKNNPTIIATTGWTADDLISGINNSSAVTNKKFDFVTLLIGVNDQYQKLSIDNYRTKFKQLVQTAITFANGNKNRVFVLSIPDYGVTPFANGDDSTISPEIDNFNNINQSESASAGVNYLDITGISKQALNTPSLVAYDGLHPSAKMYTLWVDPLTLLVKARFN